MKILFLIAFLSMVSTVYGGDYCDKTLCSGKLHVACKNHGVSGKKQLFKFSYKVYLEFINKKKSFHIEN